MRLIFLIVCMQVFTMGIAQVETQVNRSGSPYYPNEPSIAISRTNTDCVVIGANKNNHYYSSNAGKTWKDTTFYSTYGVYGDPVLHAGENGIIYFAHLSFTQEKSAKPKKYRFIDRMVVQTSKDGGKSFDNGTYVGLNGDKMQDKPWLSSGTSSDGITCMTWTEFDKLGSKRRKHKSRIRFSYTEDEGKTWKEAITISDSTGDCIDDDHTLEGATSAIGVDGEIYCVWAGHYKLWFDKSTDGGRTWGKDKVIGEQKAGWAMEVPHVYRTNGMPFLKCDNSRGIYRGRLYLVYGDRVEGDANIYLMYSDDKGESWSNPVQVHQGSLSDGKDQFMPNVAIDPEDGTIAVVYYDRRNVATDAFSDVYLSVSKDGGQTFRDVRLNSWITASHGRDVFSGDYIDVDLYQGRIGVVWSAYQDYQKIFTRNTLLDSLLNGPVLQPKQFCFELVPERKMMKMYLRTNQPLQIGYGWSSRFLWGRKVVVKTMSIDCAEDGTETKDLLIEWPHSARFDQALVIRNGDRIVFQQRKVDKKKS